MTDRKRSENVAPRFVRDLNRHRQDLVDREYASREERPFFRRRRDDERTAAGRDFARLHGV